MVDYSKLAPLALWGVKDLYKEVGKQAKNITGMQHDVKSLTEQVADLRQVNDREAAEISQLKNEIGAIQRSVATRTAQK